MSEKQIADPLFPIRQNPEHGEHHLLNVQMDMTTILMTKILTQRAPQSATLVQSCLSICSFLTHHYEPSLLSLQCPSRALRSLSTVQQTRFVSRPPPLPDDATVTGSASTLAKHETSRSSPSPSKHAKTKKVAGREETPTSGKISATRRC